MPELPEVETVRRGLEQALPGRRGPRVEARRADLRFPVPDDLHDRVAGRRVEAVRRRAKYLLIDLEGGLTLLVHLGMSGSFRVRAGNRHIEPGAMYYVQPRLEAHDHVVLHLSEGVTATFNDPRRFGFMRLAETGALDEHPHLRGLGIEPLGEAMGAATLARATRNKRTPLKAALLDQSVIAGLGNIYVCEALHRAGLSPRRSAATLSNKDGSPNRRAKTLAPAIREVLAEAIEAGGSTLRDFSSAMGEAGGFQQRFRVYDREGEPCLRPGCDGRIARLVQSGRSTYLCPRCQR